MTKLGNWINFAEAWKKRKSEWDAKQRKKHNARRRIKENERRLRGKHHD